MKLLEKLKNAIFEDDEFEELEKSDEELEKVKKEVPVTEVVKKIDIEKTIPKKIELPKEEEKMQKPLKREQHRKTPVIFNEEDFVMEEKKLVRVVPCFSVFVICSVRILRIYRIVLLEHGFSRSVTEFCSSVSV